MGTKHIEITILGSGTSTGVPTIGCSCKVCTSKDPLNKRLRSSILITFTSSKKNIIIDTGPDFREQVLRNEVKSADYVFYTHTHADHCHGFDDLRAFVFRTQKPIPCWISHLHAKEFKERFRYAFEQTGYPGTKPQVELNLIHNNSFQIEDTSIETATLVHGADVSTAYKIGRFLYATDFKKFSDTLIDQWKGKIDLMIASGVRYTEHPTHSSIPETIELFRRLKVKKGVITHLSHEVEHTSHSKNLPEFVSFAYDGLKISSQI